MSGGLGLRFPPDTRHLENWPLSALSVETPTTAERRITVPAVWRDFYNQGAKSACVGHSVSQMMSLLNRFRHDAWWLWDQAKTTDEFWDTNPGDNNGTSIRAALEILRTTGHRRVYKGHSQSPRPGDGISTYRWARSVDEIRWALAAGIPVVMGANWWVKYDRPTQVGKEYWLDRGEALGPMRGRHAFLLEAVSDRRQAVRTPNSWGRQHPRCWISYARLEQMLREGSEVAVVTDR